MLCLSVMKGGKVAAMGQFTFCKYTNYQKNMLTSCDILTIVWHNSYKKTFFIGYEPI